MRLSRHCYDKPHRCPGWNGGGMKFAKESRCDGGHIQIDYTSRWKRDWTFHRCDRCDVICWPIVVQWLDWRHWTWQLRHWKFRLAERILWPAQYYIVTGLARLCDLIDNIPAYRRRPDPEKGWHWTRSQWGCWPLRLATTSDKLDQRWKTRVWGPVPEGEGKQDDDHTVY